MKDENFIKTSKTPAEHFLHRFREENKQFMAHLPREDVSVAERLQDQQKFYIIKNLDLFILLKMSIGLIPEIEVDVRASPILVYLKQRQIRLIIRALSDLTNHRSDRPK